MSDYRRANYIPLSENGGLDFFKANYVDIKFNVATQTTFTVTDAFAANLPGIAYQVYGDAGLWWVVAQYNGILDPINDVATGLVLNIPSLSDVLAYLQALQSSSELARVPVVTI